MLNMFFFINEATKIAVSFKFQYFMLCCSGEKTLNMVFQLLKDSNIEISFE